MQEESAHVRSSLPVSVAASLEGGREGRQVGDLIPDHRKRFQSRTPRVLAVLQVSSSQGDLHPSREVVGVDFRRLLVHEQSARMVSSLVQLHPQL
eukprot:754191-Hanusia_phi.AAC.3